MPKRQTILYTSNDAPRTKEAQLFVYYCKYSGKHAFTTGRHGCVCLHVCLQSPQTTGHCMHGLAAAVQHTRVAALSHPLPTALAHTQHQHHHTDVDIENLPRRRADNSRILDRTKHTIRLYTTDGGTKLLRRPDGKVERQYRCGSCKLHWDI